ncbi:MULTISPECIES: hypothetical protein [Streptomyces violaceoruber group]|uniref:Uncharacterized protein n=2 Tax=Streptomyces violaceoruber group TaxID=2867121 RepID=A0ACD4WPJ0_STRVN|nr:MULTISPECIES: hypothetical protein [Streptomyces anthocyanicus group]MCW8117029.1 hypothetical protein [Streptomyces anthocyanicus]MCZ4636798.1 hypothetical protein [Streptomyces rubrogriseus]WOY99452.1 hypothetical protein R2E43_19125 [Streptomyces violaceoruber]WTC09923.1 hypothetical protein OHA15_19845 [Streptomyces anthocyanicus]
MGRWCTARRSAATGRVAVTAAVLAAVLATTAALPGATSLAPGLAAGSAGSAAGYDFADDAVRIAGARATAGAEPLAAGATYRSSLPRNGTLYYRLELDAASDAYVSVTAVPGADGEVTAVDGIRVSVQDAEGGSCSVQSATFGAARSPRPVTARGMREIDPAAHRCQDPGTYYVGVERTRPQDSPPDDWDLELTVATEPRPRETGATKAPEAWDSASPEPLAGEPERRPGGNGFAHATLVGQGVWRDDIRPGETLYYKVPVDWGRQVYATAELAGSADASGYATGALRLALHNPVRGEVDDAAKGYTGRTTTVGLAPLPPVAYPNRYATGQAGALRFAGDYYVVVHLAAQVADDFGQGPFTLTLRLRLGGSTGTGPGYAGESRPKGLFEVSAQDRVAAPAGGGADDRLAMKAVAVGGIGTGSLLLLGLAVWTATARRRPRP